MCRQVADVDQVAVHFAGDLCLFFGGAGDDHVAFVDLFHGAVDSVQGLARALGDVQRRFGAFGAVAHRADGLFRAGLNAADHAFDFAGRLLGAMCQGTDFVGDDGKATSCFTGPRCFDGGVQCQQIGLVGQAANHVEHLADITRLIGQADDQLGGALHVATHALNGADGFLNQVAAIARRGRCAARCLRSAGGVARHFFHGAGHLVDRSGSLFYFVVLLHQPACAFVSDGIQFFGCRGQLRGRAGNTLQGIAQLVLHGFHGQQQTTGFIGAVDTDRPGQVALRDGLRCEQCGGNRCGNALDQHPGKHEGQQGGGDQQSDHHIECRVILDGGLLLDLIQLRRIDIHQLAQHNVHLVGVADHFVVEQALQFVDVVRTGQRFQAVFKLAILAQQLHVLAIEVALVGGTDQLLVNGLSVSDLLVAHRHQLDGFLLGFRIAIDQQSIGQHPQTNADFSEAIEALDAGHVAVGQHLGGAADLAHL